MKKLLLQALLIASALSVKAQIMMEVGDRRYDISTIDSIVFVKTELPTAATLMDNSGEYSIFAEALRITGLADSLLTHERDKTYQMDNPTDRSYNRLYYPSACNIGFTLFAEKDAVLRAAGIYSFNDLAEKCKEWYGNPTWYDLIGEQGIKISTGTDYTNEWNVVHMFVAYHIIRAQIQVDQLVYERNSRTSENWNYCFGYEPQAYYETMLQGSLLKIWQTNPKTTKDLWINRYLKNNTLTDQYATFGSEAMHPLIYSGAKIDRNNSLETMNACIHSIDKVLLYDQNAHDAQHERMRFHINQMLPELGTNGFMRATMREISGLNGGDGTRIAFPADYFDNLHCYYPNMVLRYNVMGAWRALESTQLQGWSDYDFAIRLPRVPSGRYEIRFPYYPMDRGGEIEFYIGNDSTQSTMQKVSTLNAVENPYNGNMGYEEINAYEGKYGIESGKAMRQKGFMYAPASFSRGTLNYITDPLPYDASDPYSACQQMTGSTSCRTEGGYGTMQLRYIVATVDMKQGQDYWLRLKGNPTGTLSGMDLGWSFNFIELVPTDVADNATYMEDWY